MIFSIGNHIQQIMDGSKTQTRRPTDRYEIGKTYAIQPGRGKKAIRDGRIEIIEKWEEVKGYPTTAPGHCCDLCSAREEGGYSPDEYEALYEKLYPDWKNRYAYEFKFVPKKEGMQ